MSTTSISRRLDPIRTKLQTNQEVEPVSVRMLLGWFGFERRGYWVVSRVRRALQEAGLKTVPDFDGVHIDSSVDFTLDEPVAEILVEPMPAVFTIVGHAPTIEISGPVSVTEALIAGALADPAFRVGRLESANKRPLSVPPNCTLCEAVTLMLRHDYSQLAVMSNERDIKGIVSWETIGSRLALGKTVTTVRECMKPHHEVGSNESLFKVIAQIVEHSYVLVRGEDRTVTGIVTTTDLSLQFQQLSEPFLLLSEIENHIRLLIDGRFTADELSGSKDSADPLRKIESVADLTFGEYIRLLENPLLWVKTGLTVDRAIFVRELDHVRRIRNDVMHFDPDGITDEDHALLRHFVQFMHDLRAISG